MSDVLMIMFGLLGGFLGFFFGGILGFGGAMLGGSAGLIAGAALGDTIQTRDESATEDVSELQERVAELEQKLESEESE